jgi:phage-related baseplate assembly protein
MQEHMQARLRSGHRVSLENVVMTAVEVEARVTLAPGYSLEQVFQSGAAALVALMDYRRLDFGTDVDEAKLLSALSGTEGIASVETSTFLPAADVVVGAYSLPVLARLSLMDTDSGVTINASLSVSFS